MKRQQICFTVGYQGRGVNDLCFLLTRAGVVVLVDVRERAWSQRPEFRKVAFREALKKHGIHYLHMKEAGNPFRPGNGDARDFSQCAEDYRLFLLLSPNLLKRALELVSSHEVAFFCYESSNEDCHRTVLVEELRRLQPSLEVEHL